MFFKVETKRGFNLHVIEHSSKIVKWLRFNFEGLQWVFCSFRKISFSALICWRELMDSLINSKKELFSLWSTQLLFALVTVILGCICSWIVTQKLNYSCENGLGIWIGLLGAMVACVGLISLKKSLEIKRKIFFYLYIILCILDIICCAILIHISGKCFKYWSAVFHYNGFGAAEVASWLNMALLFICLIHGKFLEKAAVFKSYSLRCLSLSLIITVTVVVTVANSVFAPRSVVLLIIYMLAAPVYHGGHYRG